MSSVLMIWQIFNSYRILFILRKISLVKWKQITKWEWDVSKSTLLPQAGFTMFKPFVISLVAKYQFVLCLLSNLS